MTIPTKPWFYFALSMLLTLGYFQSRRGCSSGPVLAKDIALQRRDFQTFSISVPTGELKENTISPTLGKYVVSTPLGDVLIAWQQAVEPTDIEQFKSYVLTGFPSGTETRRQERVSASNVSGVLVELRSGNRVSLSSLFYCDTGVEVAVMAGATFSGDVEDARRELASLHHLVFRTLHCSEKAPATASQFPVFRPPEGYGYLRSSPRLYGPGRQFLSLDGSTFMVQSTFSGNSQRGPSPELIGTLLQRMGDFEEEPRTLSRTRADGEAIDLVQAKVRQRDDSTVHVMIRWLSCKPADWGLVFTGKAEAATEVVDALAGAKCPSAESSSLDAYASATTVHARACVAGDQRGCSGLRSLIRADLIRIADMPPDEQALACTAGISEACAENVHPANADQRDQ